MSIVTNRDSYLANPGNLPFPFPLPTSAGLDNNPAGLFQPHQPALRFRRDAMRNLSPRDRRLFERFGQGPLVAPAFTCVHRAFEAQAAAHPHLTAAEHLGETISYGELGRQADRLAALLARHGVRNGDNVALFLERSVAMVVGIVATLKAGAAYVPQHVGVAPEAYLRHIVDVAGITVILTVSWLRDQVPVPDGCVCIAVDEVMQQPLDGVASFTPPREVDPDDRCFIIFTSGTTGAPNGVQVTHRNACNILLTAPGDLGMRPGVRVAQILSIAFDMAAWETLGSLTHGATLVIRGKSIQEAVQRADVVIATPSVLGALDTDQCRNVRVVAVAGEPCPRPLAEKWASFCAFHNSCGPTETTIVNTVQRFYPSSERLTIGKPTPNNTVYVLDEHMQPCAIGEVGEMWAGGDCVTTGYLQNPELTQARYAPDPFLGSGRVMFRTRDLGRWTPDGELEHFGRTDDQVKVRGFRVELDSVSNVLESTPGCQQAVTLKLDSRNLVAFVRPAGVDVEQARQAVEDALPYYCTPAFVIALESFPMTSRGKVDKRTLLQLAAEWQRALAGQPAEPTREAVQPPLPTIPAPVLAAVLEDSRIAVR